MIDAVVIIALCGLIGWQEYQNRKEKQRLINIIISKNNQELRDIEIADQTQIKVKTEPKPSDLVPEQDLTDQEFDKMIKETNG
jgi:hypothetical protein